MIKNIKIKGGEKCDVDDINILVEKKLVFFTDIIQKIFGQKTYLCLRLKLWNFINHAVKFQSQS